MVVLPQLFGGGASLPLGIPFIQKSTQFAGEVQRIEGLARYLSQGNGIAGIGWELHLVDVDAHSGYGVEPSVPFEMVFDKDTPCLSFIPLNIFWPFDTLVLFPSIPPE